MPASVVDPWAGVSFGAFSASQVRNMASGETTGGFGADFGLDFGLDFHFAHFLTLGVVFATVIPVSNRDVIKGAAYYSAWGKVPLPMLRVSCFI